MSVFNKAKVELEVSLDPELPCKLEEVLGDMMKMMGMPSDLIFSMVKVFNKVNLAVNFNSPE